MDFHTNLHIDSTSDLLLKEYRNEFAQITNSDRYYIILFESTCICYLNFREYKVVKNSLLFLKPTDTLIVNRQNQKLMSLSFDQSVFDEICLRDCIINGLLYNNFFNTNFLKTIREEIKDIKLKINTIIESYNNSNYEEAKQNLINIIEDGINKKHGYIIRNSNKTGFSIIYQYLSMIQKHFTMNHNVSYYANKIGIPQKSLAKLFSDFDLESPKKFLNERILLEAKKLLIHTTKTNKDVAYDIGFNELAYFSRFFKKNTGMTTTQFKNYYYLVIVKTI